MTTPQFDAFWQQIAAREATTGNTFEVKARFAADSDGRTPITLIVEDGEPFVVVDEVVAQLRAQLRPGEITAHFPREQAARWTQAFEAISDARRLTLNQACRLILGPTYRPSRANHLYNANREFFVRARDIASWVDGVDSTDEEVRLLSLYGPSTESEAAERLRPDANSIALRALRSILEAAHDFAVNVGGTDIEVSVDRLDSPPWPRIMEGLGEVEDGPWPAPVAVRCSWSGGFTELLARANTWNQHPTYRDYCGLSISENSQELLWITVALAIKQDVPGDMADVPTTATLFRKREPLGPGSDAGSRAVNRMLRDAGLYFPSPKQAIAFQLEIPSGSVRPSAPEVFERLVTIALAKQPFLTRDPASAAFDAKAMALEADEEANSAKHSGMFPLPGGVRAYKETLDKILEWVAGDPKTKDQFAAFMQDEFDVAGKTALAGYVRLPGTIGLLRANDNQLELTAAGMEYLKDKPADQLFDLLHARFTGLLETLVIIRDVSGETLALSETLQRLLGKEWRSDNQIAFRRNWLLSLGLTDRKDHDEITSTGLATLARYAEEVAEIEANLEQAEDTVDEPDVSVAASADAIAPKEPPGWNNERVDLTAVTAQNHVGAMVFSPSVIEQSCAALSAGKHLLLVGPPGTGKTELAFILAKAAQSEGYCAGLFSSTASADWTTYETIGGYALQRDSSLSFRPGVFLRALERFQWLLIDELNRADIDKAFGELMTVLAGKGADTPFVADNGELISIGPDEGKTHQMPRTFRVVATMNIWDKTSLFRLSYAVQRRFAIVHVGVPDAATYGTLLEREARKEWLEPPLAEAVSLRLQELFSPKALLALRAVGPAIPLDMIRYMRRRQAAHMGMAEAVTMFLLPQLEGVEPRLAEQLWALLAGSIGGDVSAESYLRARFVELFPLAQLPANT